jgi:hypothetical protein
MDRPFQCGALTIGWSGDEGPYHLLLTPIEIRQHSYNVSPRPRRAERDDRGKWSESSEGAGSGQGAIERSGIRGRPGNRTKLTNRYGYLLSTMVRISIQ